MAPARLFLCLFAFTAGACGGGSDAPSSPTPTDTPTPITVTLRLSVTRPTASSIQGAEKGSPVLGASTALAIEILTGGGNATVTGSCTPTGGLVLGPGAILNFAPTGPITPGTPFLTTLTIPVLAPFPLPDTLGIFDCRVTGTDQRGGGVSVTQTIVLPSNAVSGNTAQCVPGSTTLCLLNNRFRVEANWRTASGQTGQGQVPATDGRYDDGGYFWFFNSDNVDMVVQMLSACDQAPSRFWVFAAADTNIEVNLTVTDAQTGVRQTYRNPQGTDFGSITDTNAFATCP
jgi:hypothetical protein